MIPIIINPTSLEYINECLIYGLSLSPFPFILLSNVYTIDKLKMFPLSKLSNVILHSFFFYLLRFIFVSKQHFWDIIYLSLYITNLKSYGQKHQVL